MRNELAGRFGAEWHEAGEDYGRDAANRNEIAPSMGKFGEASSKGVGSKLAKGDAEVIKGDHPPTLFGRGELSDVEWLVEAPMLLKETRARDQGVWFLQ